MEQADYRDFGVFQQIRKVKLLFWRQKPGSLFANIMRKWEDYHAEMIEYCSRYLGYN